MKRLCRDYPLVRIPNSLMHLPINRISLLCYELPGLDFPGLA